MLREKAIRIGRINKTHGVNGQLSVVTENRISEPDEWPEWVFLDIDVGLVPFRTRSNDMIWRDENHIIIALKEQDNQDKVIKLVGYEVWFPIEYKKIALESTVSAHPLIGFTVSELTSGEIGAIDDFLDLPNNPLFKIERDGKEILIPARDEWIVDLNETAKKIMMELPEGLLEL